ncbi:MAG: 2-dehydropantoate 2-reductase, partial [Pseudomonadota bacterium]|nr:2-dehydropantoate 2-reductase [Pseudomonadota bacterium]
YKLWGNMTMNPVSALSGALSDAILDDPLVRDFMLRCMAEAAAIGCRIGCPIAESGEARLQVARELGGFRTSMLQDVEAGRRIELDALLGAVFEIGARVGVATPNVAALLGLTRLMARTRRLYPPA